MLLGFSATALSQVACMYGPRQSDYGALTMDFEVSGKVVDKESAPIAGIEVSCSAKTESGVSSVLTAGDGSFFISGTGVSPLLQFKDIDGSENGGEFAEKFKVIEVDRAGKGDGNAYVGKYQAKGVVVEMEKK